MITLYVIRHGEAHNGGSDDKHRELTTHGKESIVRLGEVLRDQNSTFDLVLASAATRTKQSAELLAESKPVVLLPQLYLASARQIAATLCEFADRARSIVLVGHNPGLSDFVTKLGFPIALNTAQCVRVQAQNLTDLLAGELLSANLVDAE